MKIKLIRVDTFNPENGKFLLKLFNESASVLWDDKHRDVLSNIADILTRPNHFIVEIDGVMGGYVGAVIDVYDNAYIEGACLKEYQRFYPAQQTALKFCKKLFDPLRSDCRVRKIKALVPVFNKSAEVVLRSIALEKEG